MTIKLKRKYKNKICAVIVTYCPNLHVLGTILDALHKQVTKIVIVDNNSTENISKWNEKRKIKASSVIRLHENLGIAVAHNVGIAWAREQDSDFVIFFDHDSLPDHDMVARLLRVLQGMMARGIKVAAVGPRYLDGRNTNRPPFFKVRKFQAIKQHCSDPSSIVDTDLLISSGCLIPIEILNEVGGPIDAFFVDQVDIEWCLRAKSKGYRLFGVCDAVLHHSLGENPITLFGRKILHHGPLRSYYIFRNATYLIFKRYVPVGWKFFLCRTLFLRFFAYVLFVPPRFQFFKMMTRGSWHGLCGRFGKLPGSFL